MVSPTPEEVIMPSNTPVTTKGGLVVGTTENNTVTISGDSYTVMHGDNLWSIAIKAYGNGYKWTQIAKANKLTHPGTIHAGNVLQIPR
jgi:nucleoid-associated protein YgaU